MSIYNSTLMGICHSVHIQQCIRSYFVTRNFLFRLKMSFYSSVLLVKSLLFYIIPFMTDSYVVTFLRHPDRHFSYSINHLTRPHYTTHSVTSESTPPKIYGTRSSQTGNYCQFVTESPHCRKIDVKLCA